MITRQQDEKFLYFLRAEMERPLIKIGCSVNPCGRLENIQQWSPIALTLVAEIACDQRFEQMLHQHFYHDHSHGEWFRLTEELQRVIDGANCGLNPSQILNLQPRGKIQGKRRKNRFGVGHHDCTGYKSRLSKAAGYGGRRLTKAERAHFRLATSFVEQWAANGKYDYDRPTWPQLEYVERVCNHLRPKYGLYARQNNKGDGGTSNAA